VNDRGPKRAMRRRSAKRRRSTPARGDAGMTLIELVIAISVLALVMTGLAASIGISFKAVQLARARQVAEAAANKRLEELRDVDYPNLALESMPVYNPDPDDPDHFVSGTSYDYSGKGDLEPMIVVTDPPGPVAHIENPVVVGSTVVAVYQYVTSVDDPTIAGTENLRRVTVVVKYHNVAVNGTDHILRESVLFTPGTVTLPSAASSTTTTTTSPGATTTTTSPASTCGSFSVSGGGASQVGYTATPTVTVTLNLSGCGTGIAANLSNDGSSWSPDITYNSSDPTSAWTLTGGEGTHQISGIAHNSAGSWALAAKSIILDTTLPTTPGTLTRTASCQGSTRTVNLSWSTSSDTNLVGYRVYRSTDGVTWQVVSSTTGTSATDSHSKTLTTVRFYVKAYDRAGNDSNATNTITLSKNQCS
jgi:prepilin-type N-terminal cleavage/methylation domain-containing protein